MRGAFKDLIKAWGRSNDLQFIPEHEYITPAKKTAHAMMVIANDPGAGSKAHGRSFPAIGYVSGTNYPKLSRLCHARLSASASDD